MAIPITSTAWLDETQLAESGNPFGSSFVNTAPRREQFCRDSA